MCSEASCLSKDRPGLVREGYFQLDYSLHNLRTKLFISLCFSYANCKGNKQKVKTKQQAIVLLSSPYLKSGLFTQKRIRPRRGMGCLSSTLHLCPYHSSMHTVLELLLSLSVSGTDCEAAEGRHTYLICYYSQHLAAPGDKQRLTSKKQWRQVSQCLKLSMSCIRSNQKYY